MEDGRHLLNDDLSQNTDMGNYILKHAQHLSKASLYRRKLHRKWFRSNKTSPSPVPRHQSDPPFGRLPIDLIHFLPSLPHPWANQCHDDRGSDKCVLPLSPPPLSLPDCLNREIRQGGLAPAVHVEPITGPQPAVCN